MKIGITYDLREDYLRRGYNEEETAEFDSIETVDAIAGALSALGHTGCRIGTFEQLVRQLAAGERWDLVFNFAEGLRGFGREAQVPAALEAYDIPCTFADSMVLAIALHKGMTKHILRDMGVPTPDFAVVHRISDVPNVRIPYPVFAKPVAGGTSMGISAGSIVETQQQLSRQCETLLARFRQPVLVEEFLTGRELTVGMVGTGESARALGVMEILLNSEAEAGVYSHLNKKHYVSRVRYAIANDETAREANDLALRVWTGLGCRDGGRIDFRCDARGRVQFMEVNPLAGLHPVDSDLILLCRLLEIPYVELIRMILDSALERVPCT